MLAIAQLAQELLHFPPLNSVLRLGHRGGGLRTRGVAEFRHPSMACDWG